MPHSSIPQNAVLRARRLLQSSPLFFDTETTGVHCRAEIIEIGIVDVNGETALESFVRPLQRISVGATAVHGITNHMVMHAPTWAEIWPQMKQLFAGRRVGIYNADFDLRMMWQSHALHNLPWQAVGGSAFCVMKLYAQFYGEARGQREYRWQSLKNAGQQCGIPLPNSHRAADDARLACALVHHIAKLGRSRIRHSRQFNS